MNKTIITVVGKDTVGIKATARASLAVSQVNMQDISPTSGQDFFHMKMIVDMTKMEKPFEVVANELEQIGKEIGVQVKCQREEIFDMMHRI